MPLPSRLSSLIAATSVVAVTLPVQAVETGADYNVAAETVKEITNPMDGVSACTNPAAIDGGRGLLDAVGAPAH